MLNMKSIVLALTILLSTACNQAPLPPGTLPATIPASETSTVPPESPTLSPTETKSSTLKGGQWTYIFYHEELEQVLLVNGGPEQGKPADEPLELWSWDGTEWWLVRADENGPTWRNWPAVAYDSTRDVLIVHGGLQSGTNFDETWEWDGQAWKRFTDPGPGAREGALMAYDAARGKTILFGGSTPDLEIHGDTWAWDGQRWTLISESGPAPRFPGGMVFDAARQEILLYSGHFAASTGEFVQYDDLWSWDGSSWREIPVDGSTPGHRTHAGFVYDPMTKNVFLIGSGSDTFIGDVWAWDGEAWEEIRALNTPARSGHNVAYDPKRDRFVLFGGVDRPGGTALKDTWEWDRVQWSCVNNC
jgi:hypothetical protein